MNGFGEWWFSGGQWGMLITTVHRKMPVHFLPEFGIVAWCK
jgi:hypothetical protein